MIKAGATPYGIKAVRQIKGNREPTKRQAKKVSDTYQYFLEKVDPVISACITHLLLEQPEPSEIPDTMLEFLTRAGPRLDVEVIPGQKALHRSRKELKLYLAISIGPVVAQLVNRLAVEQPDDVIIFMKSDLKAMGAQLPAMSAPEELRSDAKRSATASAAASSDDHHTVERPATTGGTIEVQHASTNPTPDPAAAGSHNQEQQAASSSASYTVENKAIKTDFSATAPVEAVVVPKALVEEKSIQIAVFGLGGAGKSSLINRLQGSIDKVRPTIGFRPVSMRLSEEMRVRFYDLGGGKKIRDIWSQYFHDVHGVVFVLDASIKDEDAVKECVEVFTNTMRNTRLVGKPLLVLANKQDIEGALSGEQWKNILFPSGEIIVTTDDGERHQVNVTFRDVSAHVPEGASPQDSAVIDPRIEGAVETLLESVLARFDELQLRVEQDTKLKNIEEAQKRIARDRKVLRSKIACAFHDTIDAQFAADNHIEPEPDKIFMEEEGLSFLCGEMDLEVSALPQIAIDVARMAGYHQLALQLIGGLKAPISKKKTPMEWQEIYELVLEIRAELGLP